MFCKAPNISIFASLWKNDTETHRDSHTAYMLVVKSHKVTYDKEIYRDPQTALWQNHTKLHMTQKYTEIRTLNVCMWQQHTRLNMTQKHTQTDSCNACGRSTRLHMTQIHPKQHTIQSERKKILSTPMNRKEYNLNPLKRKSLLQLYMI